MVINIKEIWKIMKEMVKVFLHGHMVINMKAIGKMVWREW